MLVIMTNQSREAFMRTVLAIIAILLCVTPTQAEEPFHLSTDANFPPYSELVDGKIQGIDIDIIREAATRAEIDVIIEAYPWKRAMMMLSNGDTDGTFSVFRNEEREAYALFSKHPVHVSDLAVFMNRSSRKTYGQLGDLFGQTVFIAAGFSISDDFDEAVRTNKIRPTYARDTEDGLARLLESPSGYLISNRVSVLYYARKRGVLDTIRSSPLLVRANRGAYLAIPRTKKTTPALQKMLDSIDHELGKMWDDGTIDAIIAPYITTPPTP